MVSGLPQRWAGMARFWAGRKVFFFEKKEQKPFYRLSRT